MSKKNTKIAFNIGFDTLYFIVTKYALHHGLDMTQTKNVNNGDIGVFIAADGVSNIFLTKYYVDKGFNVVSGPAYNCDINKYGSVMLGASLLNIVLDRKERIIDNLISIGTSGVLSAIVDSIRGESRCTDAKNEIKEEIIEMTKIN